MRRAATAHLNNGPTNLHRAPNVEAERSSTGLMPKTCRIHSVRTGRSRLRIRAPIRLVTKGGDPMPEEMPLEEYRRRFVANDLSIRWVREISISPPDEHGYPGRLTIEPPELPAPRVIECYVRGFLHEDNDQPNLLTAVFIDKADHIEEWRIEWYEQSQVASDNRD